MLRRSPPRSRDTTSVPAAAVVLSRLLGHAQSCLLWGKQTLGLFICPGKASSSNEEQRDQVSRVAERDLWDWH